MDCLVNNKIIFHLNIVVFVVAVVGGRSSFPVCALAYAPQGGLTVRFEMNGGSASNVEVSKKYTIGEAEIPRHSFLH
jgi:branched-subunit amino acid ABC-type transport system permease component